MAGGLLNIISVGTNNMFLTGNPTKTFFKVKYSKYTNFGLQKFRIDYDGQRDLRLNEPSTFTFKIPRHADLLMDTYIVLNLPDIWSPIMNPTSSNSDKWVPYDFKWIQNLGIQMISEITITCGAALIQRYSGQYLSAMVERDFPKEKKDLFYKMTGNVKELNDPANTFSRSNTYPSAFFTGDVNGLNGNPQGSEPSIRGRQLFIPINTWFTLDSRCAFPLVALQYNELHINVTLRPIRELFQVRDVFDSGNNFPYVQPDFNQPQFNMYYFLQTPPTFDIYDPATDVYENKTNNWNADIHLITTYCFLSNEEARTFAAEDQVYLIKDVFEYNFQNITGSQKVKITSNGMISNWMWFLQRNDANLRNEWSNYTNWPYDKLPANIIEAPYNSEFNYGPSIHPSDEIPDVSNQYAVIGNSTGYYYTGIFQPDNKKEILETMGIIFDGGYRENILTRGVYEYIEKYVRTNGGSDIDGLYSYNFCLNTSPFDQQPSGAINLSKFRTIELELTTYIPPIDTKNSNITTIFDQNGIPIGINKQNWKLFEYNYNMTVFEERYNILSFMGGNCQMLYAR